MSSNISWTEIRRGLGDPIASQLRGLINKQNMFINQVEQPTQQKARGIGRATFSRLTYQDPFTYGFVNDYKTRFFLPPMEPDGQYLTCWIPMKSLGRFMTDLSHFRNHAYLKGRPLMCNGPDDGIFGGRIAIEFNSIANQDDYLYVPHKSNISVGLAATGISIFARVKFNSFEGSGGVEATVCQKVDDVLGTSGFALRVGEDRRLKWAPKTSDVVHEHITSTDTVEQDVIYDIGCRYNSVDDSTAVYLDGDIQNDVASEVITLPSGDATDLRLCMGNFGNSGRASVTFYDFRLYYEYLISTAEWGHLFLNKRSISDIPYGLVAAEGITQVEYSTPFTDGFTDGFTH